MVSQYKDYLNKQIGKRDTLQSQLEIAKESVVSLTKRAKDILDAQVIIQQVAVNTQAGIVFRVNEIVNKVLQAVFPEYSFELVYEVRRNKSEATMKFYCGANEVDILDSTGGGVSDVASLGLRLAVWTLSGAADTMVLDETTKFISADLQPRIADIMSELSKALKLQMILVSHSQPLNDRADKLFTVSLDKKGVSQVV